MERILKKPLFPNLEATLRRRGYNYRSLAMAMNVAPNYITRRMSGEVTWNLNDAFEIADLLNETIDFLFKKED